MRVDDLRVGDELEVAVTTPFSYLTLGGDDLAILALVPDPSPDVSG